MALYGMPVLLEAWCLPGRTGMICTCKLCGKEMSRRPYAISPSGNFCSYSCKGKFYGKGSRNPNWRGGKINGSAGYELSYAPEHPAPSTTCGKTKYVLTHRAVMEQHLGRTLLPNEIVHHKNHNAKDNRIENLEVTTRAAHLTHHLAEWRKRCING